MARDNKPTNASADAPTQAQTGSGEQQYKDQNKPEKNTDEIQHFESTVAKLAERENEDGEKEWVEVMSDNLYPGEKLKRAADDEKTAEKAKAARETAQKAAENRK
jgi:hypothetical protein